MVNGAVFPLEDGHTAHVRSQRDPNTAYLVNGRCNCKSSEYRTEPCAHRFAFRLYQRVSARLTVDPEERWEPIEPAEALVAAADATAPAVPAPLPEAAFSLTLKGTLDGVEALLTARGQTAAEFRANLEVIRGLLDPVPAKPSTAVPPQGESDTTPQCPTHGALKRSTKGKGWYCPTKLDDGAWCQSKSKGRAA